MAKIIHLSSVHQPFDIRIFIKECQTLAQAGYEVVLIVQHVRDEDLDGVRIKAIPKTKNRFQRLFTTIWQVYQAALQEEADLYHFHDPELIPVGLLLKLQGKRVVYDVHEAYSASLLSDSRDWLHPRLRNVVSKSMAFSERFAEKWFDGIVAATPFIASHFSKYNTVTVQNLPIINELVTDTGTPYQERPRNIAYVGGISKLRGVREMVEAMALLPDNFEARFFLAGRFKPAELEKEVAGSLGWKRVVFLGMQSRKEVAVLFGRVRIGLVLFLPAPNHIMAQPNKLFEYMSAGLPVVASAFPLWQEIIGGAGCGLLVDPLDPQAIAEAIQWLLEHPVEAEEMGRRGQIAVQQRYNWNLEANKLLSFYQQILK